MMYAYNEQKKRTMLQEGFTLIELMIGIVIIGLIVGASAYFFMGYLNSARRQNAKTVIQGLKTTIMLYKNEKDELPKTLSDLIKAGVYRGGKTIPLDPWNNKFVYRPTPGGQHEYELYSYGPDGKSGNKASRINAWDK